MNNVATSIRAKRINRTLAIAMSLGVITLMVAGDAAAQSSIKQTAVSVFNILYGLMGVAAGIALLVQILNWKFGNFLGSQDPKKLIVQTLIATALGFGIVGIIQGIKTYSASNADISSV
jgi:hypothetical protein